MRELFMAFSKNNIAAVDQGYLINLAMEEHAKSKKARESDGTQLDDYTSPDQRIEELKLILEKYNMPPLFDQKKDYDSPKEEEKAIFRCFIDND